MLGDISLATNIYIVTGYTDMRKSIDGLCAIVVDRLKEEPNTSSLYMQQFDWLMSGLDIEQPKALRTA